MRRGKPKTSAASAEYEVGHAKPPAKYRFRKGQSGNPAGRPKSSSAAITPANLRAAFFKAANQRISITVGGKLQRMSRGEAVVHRLVAEALKGNHKSLELYLDYMAALERADDKEPKPPVQDLALLNDEELAQLEALVFKITVKK